MNRLNKSVLVRMRLTPLLFRLLGLLQHALPSVPLRECGPSNPKRLPSSPHSRSTERPFAFPNRAASDGNAPSPHRRISKQADKNGRWIIRLTNRPAQRDASGDVTTASNVVSHTRVVVTGFRLVKVRRGTLKSSGLCLEETTVQATTNCNRFVVCNRLELKKLSIQ